MDELEKNWKYQNTTLYIITCKDTAITRKYVGHTTDFTSRKKQHERGCLSYPNRKLYNFINANGGWSNFKITPIETIACFSQLQAIEKEQYWTTYYGADLNDNSPSKNPRLRGYRQSWYSRHKEEQLARMRKQYILKKELKNMLSVGL